MAVQTKFKDWGSSGLNSKLPQFERVSPNTRALADYLVATFGGQIVGGHNERTIAGSSKKSAHAYGAASDWRYEPNWLTNTTATTVNRQAVLDLILPWVIEYGQELGIQAIHDYVGDRIWRPGRGWKKQNGAGAQMGESWARWIHFETTQEDFLNGMAIDRRGIPLINPNGQAPAPTPDVGYNPNTPLPTQRLGSTGEWAFWLIEVLKFWGWYPAQHRGDRNDSKIGSRSVEGIKTMQRALGVAADGVYGPKSARAYSDFLYRMGWT